MNTSTYKSSGSGEIPIRWCPPEVLSKLEFSEKSDVWSFGCLMYEIFTDGKLPYSRLSNKEVINKVLNGETLEFNYEHSNKGIIFQLEKVFISCFSMDKQTRPNFKKLHSEIKRINNELIDVPQKNIIRSITSDLNLSNDSAVSSDELIPSKISSNKVFYKNAKRSNNRAIYEPPTKSSSNQLLYVVPSKSRNITNQLYEPPQLEIKVPKQKKTKTKSLNKKTKSIKAGGSRDIRIHPLKKIEYREICNKVVLGKGHFGDTVKGIITEGKRKNQEVAIKKINKEHHNNEEAINDFIKESLLLQSVKKCPNIIEIFYFNNPKINKKHKDYSIVMELCNRGDLLSFLKEIPSKPLELKIRMLLDVSNGMKCLAKNKIIHRDLAARNVLVNEELGKFTFKVGDYGMSKPLVPIKMEIVNRRIKIPVRTTKKNQARKKFLRE